MILGTSRAVRVFAYPRPTDLRKGFDGLYGLVQSGLRRDVLGGELFLFVNRRRDACKVLLWDGTGLCIFQKRLEKGRFAALWRDDVKDGDVLTLTASELALYIEGCALVGTKPLSPAPIVPTARNELVSDREV
jgi:transposase